MNARQELKIFAGMAAVFAAVYCLPVGAPRFDGAVREAFELVKWYAREHVLLCLVPAFFIAGAIGVFVRQQAVMQYLGPKANRLLAYGVASVAGNVLAVCSCTVLPLFTGIYRMGAGLGPATAFLYSGPAINVLAVILTARILGLELGVARAVGAVGFSIGVGAAMAWIFRKEEVAKIAAAAAQPVEAPRRPLGKTAAFFGLMTAILVFANWGKADESAGFFAFVAGIKWWLTGLAAAGLGVVLVRWMGLAWWKVMLAAAPTLALAALVPDRPLAAFLVGVAGLALLTSAQPGEPQAWFGATWEFAKQILPLLLGGVLVAGFLLGRPGHEGAVPSAWVAGLVGGNSLAANFFAAVVGAFMYFATLTEIPILQGLIGSGMGKGPALALLLAGPALSLPSMIVLCRVIGGKKITVYVALVVVAATLSGLLYGALFG